MKLTFGSNGFYPLPGQQTRTAKIEMPTYSRLGRQITEIIADLKTLGAEFALIGGLALASHKVIRATQDVDLLVDADRSTDAYWTPAPAGHVRGAQDGRGFV